MNKVKTVQLLGTKRFPIRRATFIRMADEHAVTGVLEITEESDEKEIHNQFLAKQIRFSKYAVRECCSPDCGEDRHFFLIEPNTPFGTQLSVFLADRDLFDYCECLGFEKRGGCRHQAALRELLREGVLEKAGS